MSQIKTSFKYLPNVFYWGRRMVLKRGTLEHILSCCSRALIEGHHRLRHGRVLKAIADTICSHYKCLRPVKKSFTFVRAGEKLTSAARTNSSGLLATAQDWELKIDPGKQLKFP